MKKSKLNAIKKCYGEAWEKVKDFVDDQGYIKAEYIDLIIKNPELLSGKNYLIKKLNHNNGWNRIDEKGLPTDETKRYKIGVLNPDGEFLQYVDLFNLESALFEINFKGDNNPTHWKEVQPDLKPIY